MINHNTYYPIKTFQSVDQINWETLEKAPLHYRWLNNDYEPATYGQIAFVPSMGFLIHMVCKEANPKAVHSGPDGHAYLDSCMEFFAQYVNHDPRYINIEMNATTAVLSAIGSNRFDRIPVMQKVGKTWNVTHEALSDHGMWSIIACVPLEMLSELYGIPVDMIEVGYKFKGNFYKCGDECEIPHYGMWAPIDLPSPDFHCPAYFGTFEIQA